MSSTTYHKKEMEITEILFVFDTDDWCIKLHGSGRMDHGSLMAVCCQLPCLRLNNDKEKRDFTVAHFQF